MAGKLKVFGAAMGFFDTVVAASSQKAALEAWGVRQNLFQDGAASVVTDAEAVKAALASPGVVLRRGVGASDPFRPTSEPPASLPTPPPTARKRPAQPAPQASGSKTRPPPDRSGVTAAQAALADQAQRFAGALHEIGDQRRKLDEQEAELRLQSDREHHGLETALTKALADYVKAGGKPEGR